jgi:hypothetical protein
MAKIWLSVNKITLEQVRLRFPDAASTVLRRAMASGKTIFTDEVEWQLGIPCCNPDPYGKFWMIEMALFKTNGMNLSFSDVTVYTKNVGWALTASVPGWKCSLSPGDGLPSDISPPGEVISLFQTRLKKSFLRYLTLPVDAKRNQDMFECLGLEKEEASLF